MTPIDDDAALAEALASSQRLGMLGRRPVTEVIEHAGGFVRALADVTGTVIDLGTGGGVPGLVIAAARPDLGLVLVDRRATRTDHVQRLVRRLSWTDRVEVRTADTDQLRAEDRRFDAAVARGFGPPATTLAAAAALVRPGGLVVISEPPPGTTSRWDDLDLREYDVAQVPSPSPTVATFRRFT
jgi:16S rRNA (guanine527-N7)-methyltransferase